jgi:hypothetical protein
MINVLVHLNTDEICTGQLFQQTNNDIWVRFDDITHNARFIKDATVRCIDIVYPTTTDPFANETYE